VKTVRNGIRRAKTNGANRICQLHHSHPSTRPDVDDSRIKLAADAIAPATSFLQPKRVCIIAVLDRLNYRARVSHFRTTMTCCRRTTALEFQSARANPQTASGIDLASALMAVAAEHVCCSCWFLCPFKHRNTDGFRNGWSCAQKSARQSAPGKAEAIEQAVEEVYEWRAMMGCCRR
jgi:hypothetical protein